VADPGFWQGEGGQLSEQGCGGLGLERGRALPEKKYVFSLSKLCILVNFHGDFQVSSSSVGEWATPRQVRERSERIKFLYPHFP